MSSELLACLAALAGFLVGALAMAAAAGVGRLLGAHVT